MYVESSIFIFTHHHDYIQLEIPEFIEDNNNLAWTAHLSYIMYYSAPRYNGRNQMNNILSMEEHARLNQSEK